MAIPLSSNPQQATWLEVLPYLQIYTDNNDPARSAMADKVEQRPMFILENHLMHNFTSKLWTGIDLRFQYGGETIVDGVEDGNRMNIIGGGVGLGYQFLPFLGGYVNYGRIFTGDNDAKSEMLRLSLTFIYANTKKYQ